MAYADTRINGDKDGGGILNDFDNCSNFYNPINLTVTRTGSAMFRLMLRCGLRVEEVANLTTDAIDLTSRKILIHCGNGRKNSMVYLSKDVQDALIRYLKVRMPNRCRKVFLVEKGVFKGKLISLRGIQKRIEYYAKKSLNEYSSLGVYTPRDHIRSEGLPHFKVKGKILIKQSEFDEWLESFRVDTNCQLRELVDSVIDSLNNCESDA